MEKYINKTVDLKKNWYDENQNTEYYHDTETRSCNYDRNIDYDRKQKYRYKNQYPGRIYALNR